MRYDNMLAWEQAKSETIDFDPYMIFRGQRVSLQAPPECFDSHGYPIDSWFKSVYKTESQDAKKTQGQLPDSNLSSNHLTNQKDRIRVVLASEVEDVPESYLWYPYLIDSNTNLLGGTAGTGKTFFICALMAAVTTEQPAEMAGRVDRHGKVLYIGSEDGNEAIKRRLKSLDADLNKCILVDQHFALGDDTLEEIIKAYRPVLVCIDPLMAYFPRELNPIKYNDCQIVMNELRDIARRYETCILGVVHPPKKQDYSLIHRFTGSGGFVDAVRTATYIGFHPQDPNLRVIIQPKNNVHESIPAVFELDKSLGFMWHGDDSSITSKDVETAERIVSGDVGNLEKYVDVIINVLKLNPKGIEMTASGILEEYSKIVPHDINSKSFGSALKKGILRGLLARNGIKLVTGARPQNRQHYNIYYADMMKSLEE